MKDGSGLTDSDDDNIPGFELIFIISAAVGVYFIRRKYAELIIPVETSRK